MDLSVQKINNRTQERVCLYKCITNFEDAYLLAELAMAQKKDWELICIFPGWNRSIDKDKSRIKEYEHALNLADEYKVAE